MALALALAMLALPPGAGGQTAAPVVTPLAAQLTATRFSQMPAGNVAPPWRVAGLPGQKFPLTRFDIQPIDGVAALRVRAEGSYGNLLLDTRGNSLPAEGRLRWRWRLERGLADADLLRKDGDDAAVKVCALFDMPLDGMAFGEQARLRMARALSGEPLPAATLCYVWDRSLPQDRIQANVYSQRVRYLVATHGAPRPGQWIMVERDLGADFLRAFGHESRVIPPLLALAVGADADNSGGTSLAWVGDLHWGLP